MVMGGNSVFEEALLKLDSPDSDDAVQATAVAMLDMFCLDCSGKYTLLLMLYWLTSCMCHTLHHHESIPLIRRLPLEHKCKCIPCKSTSCTTGTNVLQ